MFLFQSRVRKDRLESFIHKLFNTQHVYGLAE